MLTLTLAFQLAAAPGPVFDGRQRNTAVRPPRIDTTIVVDGALDEPVWQRAARMTGFSQYQPVDGRPAEEETDVLVWYSPTAIHFGIRARSAGGLVRASRANRDAIGSDDHVQILLDTYNDRRIAFLFGVNPFGVQQDGTRSDQFGGGAGGRSGGDGGVGINPLEGTVDLNPDFVWESRGRLVEGGYEVEVRIPFKSLRYQAGREQTWGINVLRRVQHSGYQDTWAPAVRANASFLGQSGTLEGLTDLRRGLVAELNPFATTRISGRDDAGTWRYRDTVQLGLNARWGITQNLSADGTLNPDFSQVEADVGQVTINERFALFFPEKRPFFLEGLELFDTPNQLIYTRRIVSPDWGIKLAGKVGGTNVAVMAAADDTTRSSAGHTPLFGVARLRRDLGRNSTLGLVGTLREDGPDYSRLMGADVRVVHSRLYFVELQAVQSWSSDAGGDVSGPLFQATWDRTGRSWGFNYGLNAVHPDFQAAAGFVNRTGMVSAHAFNRLTGYGTRGALFETFGSFFGVQRLWDWSGLSDRPLEGSESINPSATLRGGWRLAGSLGRNFFAFGTAQFPGVETTPGSPFVPPARLSNLVGGQLGVTTPTFRRFTGSASATHGEAAIFPEASKGSLTRLSATLDWRPAPSVRVAFQHTRVAFDREGGTRFSTEEIPRLKVEYQAGRALFLRFVGQYTSRRRDALRGPGGTPLLIGGSASTPQEDNEFRVDWLFSYRPSPGTLLYLGYGASLAEPEAFSFSADNLRRTADGFFAKVSYLFRL
jgi:hypothetical protein